MDMELNTLLLSISSFRVHILLNCHCTIWINYSSILIQIFIVHSDFWRTGIPKVTNKCGHCKSKLDFGKEFICCSDCSDPTIMDKNSKLGYCKSGADLTMQLKPQGGPNCSLTALTACTCIFNHLLTKEISGTITLIRKLLIKMEGGKQKASVRG